MSVKVVNYRTPVHAAMSIPKKEGPYIGLELEYEGANTSRLSHTSMENLWYYDTDHSLREGGIEFISKPLLGSAGVRRALERIKPNIDATRCIVTKRCGLHGHLNVLDLNLMQVWCIATLYTIVEPFVFFTYADGREDSHFCVPTWANTNLQQKFYNDATSLYRGMSVEPKKKKSAGAFLAIDDPLSKHKVPLTILQNAKYSAMNLTSLERFGTIEFRQARSTTVMREVQEWADFLLRLRREALRYTEAENIINRFDEEGFAPFCSALGLRQSPKVNPEYLVDAIDAATLMVGHKPTDPDSLTWEIAPKCAE